MKNRLFLSSRKTLTVFISCALFFCLATPTFAFAEEGSTTKTYIFNSNQAYPSYPETIEQDGLTLSVVSTKKSVISSRAETKTCGETETVECLPGDLQATKEAFPEKKSFDHEGIKGDLTLKEVTEQAVPAVVSYELNCTSTYGPFQTNDAAQVPTQAVFSGKTGNECLLDLAGISWAYASRDQYGVPTGYLAYCTYRGVDSYTVIDHYEVTAKWEADLPTGKTIETYELTVEYGRDFLPWWLFPLVATAATASCIIGIPVWLRSRRAKFTHVSIDEAGEIVRMPVGTAWVKKVEGGYTIDAKNIELDVSSTTDYCACEMPPKYVDASKTVSIYQHEKLVFCGPAQKELKIL